MLIDLHDLAVHADQTQPPPRRRSSRSCYCANPSPEFVEPTHYRAPPPIIKKLINRAHKTSVTAWPGLRLIDRENRERTIYPSRRLAINALVQGMLRHLDLVTLEIQLPVSLLAELCALSTTSAAGNLSITRASRAVIDMQRWGFIEGELIPDRDGTLLPKFMRATPRFFEALGIDPEIIRREQEWRFEAIRQGLPAEQAATMTLTTYKKQRKIASIQRAFEIRRQRQDKERQLRLARRLAGMSRDEATRVLSMRMFARLSSADAMTLHQAPGRFAGMVARELDRLLTMASTAPPPH